MLTYAVRVGKKGRITIPIEVRRDLGLETGDLIVFEKMSERILMRKATPVEEQAASRSGYTSKGESNDA